MKTCNKCKIEKPKSEFGKQKDAKDSLKARCKECRNKQEREINSTPEGKARDRARGKRERNRPGYKESRKKYNTYAWTKATKKAYRNSPKGMEIHTNGALKRKYGITLKDHAMLLKKQNGGCAICDASMPGGKFKRLLVDHDHKTDKIRGLLCMRCNTMVGCADDSPDILLKAIQYLRMYSNER